METNDSKQSDIQDHPGFKPTYKEWKLGFEIQLQLIPGLVLSLPTRNGNNTYLKVLQPTTLVLSLPTRNGNECQKGNGLGIRESFEPTYKEWKLNEVGIRGKYPFCGFEPTYKEWKLPPWLDFFKLPKMF